MQAVIGSITAQEVVKVIFIALFSNIAELQQQNDNTLILLRDKGFKFKLRSIQTPENT